MLTTAAVPVSPVPTPLTLQCAVVSIQYRLVTDGRIAQ